MVGIGATGISTIVSTAAVPSHSTSGDFVELLGAQATAGEAVTVATRVASTTAVHPMLLHQLGLEDAARRDREARRLATRMLDGLGALQLALLSGGEPAGPHDALASHLRSLAGETAQAADPRLGQILRAISARLRVALVRASLA